MPILLLKPQQMQQGADWDTVVTVSAALIGLAGLAVLIMLIVSRQVQRSRARKRHGRSRRRHGGQHGGGSRQARREPTQVVGDSTKE